MARVQLFGRDDQVTIKNPTNKDHIFGWDGKKYRVKADSTTIAPGYMAEQYVVTMVDFLMQQDHKGDQIMVEQNRQEYYPQVIVSVHKMEALSDGSVEGDIIDLGNAPVQSSNAAVQEAVKDAPPAKGKKKLKELPDPAVDEELDLDDLPDDAKLYPEPKKDKDGNYIPDDPKAAEAKDAEFADA